MRYIESDSKDPYFNLALEEYVFDRLPREERGTGAEKSSRKNRKTNQKSRKCVEKTS